MNDIEDDDEDYIDIVNTYMESYVIGIELMEKLRKDQIDLYEQIIGLETTYKRRVEIKPRRIRIALLIKNYSQRYWMNFRMF